MMPDDEAEELRCRTCGRTWRWPTDRRAAFEALGFAPPENCPRCRRVPGAEVGAK